MLVWLCFQMNKYGQQKLDMNQPLKPITFAKINIAEQQHRVRKRVQPFLVLLNQPHFHALNHIAKSELVIDAALAPSLI